MHQFFFLQIIIKGEFARLSLRRMAACGDLWGGDLYEEEQAVELAKYIENLKNDVVATEGDAVKPEDYSEYVKGVSKLVSDLTFKLRGGRL